MPKFTNNFWYLQLQQYSNKLALKTFVHTFLSISFCVYQFIIQFNFYHIFIVLYAVSYCSNLLSCCITYCVSVLTSCFYYFFAFISSVGKGLGINPTSGLVFLSPPLRSVPFVTYFFSVTAIG